MSWINSNATYKQNSKNDLSFYHGFSKTPVEPTSTGTAATTLANASTKGGHTVIGTEVWAEEIPWFGLVPSRAVAVTRLSGLAKLNDLVKVDGEGGKVYKYIGADDAVFTEAEWSNFWTAVTLTNGMVLNNRHNQPVLRYYLNQPMQTLTTTNNASIDSKGYATRLFVNEENHSGQTSGGSVVSQFAAGTDNIKNGIPSVELNPKLYYNTTEKIAGTHYYDYNVSGTVLWNENVTSKGVKISCFRYIGKTVTGQLSTVDSTVKSHALDIADIKLALGMNPNPDSPTTSVTARVETVEDVVRVLLGLGDSDAIAATESIATTANTAATTAISGALEEGGSIAQKIAAAVSAAEGRIKVTTDALQGAIDTLNGSETTTGSVAKAVADAEGRVKVTTDALAGRIAQLEGIAHFSVEVVDALPTAPVENTIYLVAEEGVAEGNYIEYIAYKPKGSESVVTEKIGSTAIDLSGYTTDAEYEALAGETGRVTVVEGKVKTLEETTIPAIQKSVTDGVAEAKTYAEQQASAAQSAAESTAAGELAAAVEQIGKDIEAAKSEAISKAEVTITAGTGIVVTPEGKGTTFEISVSDAVATASDLTALTGRVTTLENTTVPGIDTRLQAAEATITSLTEEGGVIGGIESEIEALAGETGRVTVVEGKVSDIETSLAEGGATANAIKAAQDTADAKVASVTVTDTTGTITSVGSATAPAFTVTGGVISDTETKFVSGTTVKSYVEGRVSYAVTASQAAIDETNAKSLANTGTLSGMFTVQTTGTVGTGLESITISDAGLGAAITKAKTDAEATAAAALSTARGEITSEIGTAISGVEGKSLASTSTGSDLVTVTTTGTVGTGMTTTVDTTALATAISTAESNAISAAATAAKAMVLSATDTDDSGKVTVTLGGTVETPTITVTTDDVASAATLSDLVSKVNTHISEAAGLYLSVEKVDTLPADGEAKTNKIYLVPVDTEAGREQNIHTEYIWTNNKWEIIGTTAIDINSLEAAAEAAQSTADTALANAATAQAAADKAQGEVDALEEVVATKANASEVISSISDGKGTTVTGAITVKDGRAITSVNDLWGTTATMSEDGVLTFAHDWITHSGTSWNKDITKVEDNKAYIGNNPFANIQTERIKDGSYMFYDSQLASFNGDLSSLVDGTSMFGHTQITSFDSDLSSLVNGTGMFQATQITSFDSDLSSLVNGTGMFSYSQITSFNGNLSSLVSGNTMFEQSQLASFNGDLSSLINGAGMFSYSQITSFDSDLSSLVNGSSMFSNSNLTSFNGDLSSLINGISMFKTSQFASFNGDLSSLVDGTSMFHGTRLTSFNGDLSSLINGADMFYYTNLDMESLETICDTLPKKSDIKTWNDTTKTYEEWNGSSNLLYLSVGIHNNKKVQVVGEINKSNVATIAISYRNVPTDENTRNTITALFEETANTKGWTISTNADLGGKYTPTVAMTDGTVQRYIYAIKHEADEKTANYVDANGKYWTVDTAEALIGPNVKYWSLFATVEDAITEWGLTPYTQA